MTTVVQFREYSYIVSYLIILLLLLFSGIVSKSAKEKSETEKRYDKSGKEKSGFTNPDFSIRIFNFPDL